MAYQNGARAADRQIARVAPNTLARFNTSSRNPEAIANLLAEAADYNLISPATSIAYVPDGYSILVCAKAFNPDPRFGDVYEQRAQGSEAKLSLAKPSLEVIAGMAGISWAQISINNGTHAHYCMAQAIAVYRQLDGTWRAVRGVAALDYRDNSATCDEIIAAAKVKRAEIDAAERYLRPDERGGNMPDPDKEIRFLRKFIVARAETAARLRAIRSLGIKQAYASSEIAKPFIVTKYAWTGETEDPVLRREFSLLNARKETGARALLYGGGRIDGEEMPPPLAALRVEDDEVDPEALREPPPAPSSGPRVAVPASYEQVAKPVRQDPPKEPVRPALSPAQLEAARDLKHILDALASDSNLSPMSAGLCTLQEVGLAAYDPRAHEQRNCGWSLTPHGKEALRTLVNGASTVTPPAKETMQSMPREREQRREPLARQAPARDEGPRDPRPDTSMLLPPFGREAGKSIRSAAARNLLWYRKVTIEALSDASKARYRDKNRALLDAIEAELEERAAANGERPMPANMANVDDDEIPW